MSLWNYIWGDSVQVPMSVVQSVSTVLLFVWTVYLAYRQSRTKNYDLGDEEWDVMKAFQEYRASESSPRIDSYLDEEAFNKRLNEYRTRNAGDIIVKANLPGDRSDRDWLDVEAVALLVSPQYARYCNNLVDREHLRKVDYNDGIERYELTSSGERLMREKRNTIESRFFVCVFISEVEEMQDDLRSWHWLQPGAVMPDFLRCAPSSVVGAEFPEEPDDNPCNVRCLIAAPIGREEVESRIGRAIHLELRKGTHHLAAHGQDDMILARLVYVKDRRDGLCEMWFDDPMYTPSLSDPLEVKQKKIEDTYYPNSSNRAVMPQSYMQRQARENREQRRKRMEWLRYRHEGFVARLRRRIRTALGRE